MSTKKQWPGQEKLAIVLQGLKGECSISELCNEHGITQGMYYKWRDQLLTDGAKLFDRGGVDHIRERLERENRRLKGKRPVRYMSGAFRTNADRKLKYYLEKGWEKHKLFY